MKTELLNVLHTTSTKAYPISKQSYAFFYFIFQTLIFQSAEADIKVSGSNKLNITQ